ncbi:MAG TPA: Hsp20/alpha crystallin family protein [Nitrosopumilaceae archaeon]|nr:Hsp20/alpha crystallin family protein [Nitrosopumilaceae archaeon]
MTDNFLSMFERQINTLGKEIDDYLNKELSPLSRLEEKDTEWVLDIDLPFVNKKNISVILTTHHLVIKAKLEKTYRVSKFNYVTEFDYFKKTFTLPLGIDTKRISSKFKDGILRISLPKVTSGRKLHVD